MTEEMNIPSRKLIHPTIIRLREVMRRTGLSRSTIYRRVSNGEFPNKVDLGGTTVGWLEDVDEYIIRLVSVKDKRTDFVDQSEVSVHRLAEVGLQFNSSVADKQEIGVPVGDDKASPRSIHKAKWSEFRSLGVAFLDKSTGTVWIKLETLNGTSTLTNGMKIDL